MAWSGRTVGAARAMGDGCLGREAARAAWGGGRSRQRGCWRAAGLGPGQGSDVVGGIGREVGPRTRGLPARQPRRTLRVQSSRSCGGRLRSVVVSLPNRARIRPGVAPGGGRGAKCGQRCAGVRPVSPCRVAVRARSRRRSVPAAKSCPRAGVLGWPASVGVAASGCRGRQPASRQGRFASTPRGRRDPDREACT